MASYITYLGDIGLDSNTFKMATISIYDFQQFQPFDAELQDIKSADYVPKSLIVYNDSNRLIHSHSVYQDMLTNDASQHSQQYLVEEKTVKHSQNAIFLCRKLLDFSLRSKSMLVLLTDPSFSVLLIQKCSIFTLEAQCNVLSSLSILCRELTIVSYDQCNLILSTKSPKQSLIFYDFCNDIVSDIDDIQKSLYLHSTNYRIYSALDTGREWVGKWHADIQSARCCRRRFEKRLDRHDNSRRH